MLTVSYNEKAGPVITRIQQTGEVLIWPDEREALRLTLERKRMVYYSRSHLKLWMKGETSGHFRIWFLFLLTVMAIHY